MSAFRRHIGEADRAGVRNQDLDPFPFNGSGGVEDLLVRYVVRLLFGFRPNATDAGKSQAADLNSDSGGQKDRRPISVGQLGKKRNVVVIAIDGVCKNLPEQSAEIGFRHLTGIAPVPNGQKKIRLFLFHRLPQKTPVTVQVTDGEHADPHTDRLSFPCRRATVSNSHVAPSETQHLN